MAKHICGLTEVTSSVIQALDEAHVDLLVVAAGIQEPDTLEDVTHDIMRRQMEVNALGPVLVVQALRHRLAAGGKARACDTSVCSTSCCFRCQTALVWCCAPDFPILLAEQR